MRRPLLLLIVCGLAGAAGARAAPAGGLPGLTAAARAILGPDQGVYVESADGTVLVAQAAARAVHPASISKIPTTLALLKKFGPDYRFTTTFLAHGRVLDGTLQGSLQVSSDGDPSLVDEDALLIAQRLNALGIRRIAGSLRLRGALTFDWQSDPDGARLRRALSGMTPAAAWEAVRALPLRLTQPAPPLAGALSGSAPPGVEFLPADGAAGSLVPAVAQVGGPGEVRLQLRSEPLLSMLKALDDYSNNIMAPLADEAGGPGAVQALARSVVPAAMRAEITLGDGAGEDPRNRLSPRAAVKLLRALEARLAATGHALYDVLPVAGIDAGTLQDRLQGPDEAGRVVGKTGTFGSYGASALVGAIRTTDRGTVYFAVIDHGVPVPEARRRQDRFVRVLLARLHSRPWGYRRDARPAIARVQLFMPSR
ncbi:MAG TPA: D-alanyl-D-alanine carboxypeptidase [Steroidobacteraceae bacterium]|nr:D-alanyl-D-alanine carboxypeptidase [Steroidobacteraceae bacterium]